MATITTRSGKGSALTHTEMDNNLTNLNTDKIEASSTDTLTNKTINTASNTITVVEADISDLQSYLTAETNDLTSAVTWANVPDANITQSSVTQHQAALSITESQISDLGTYLPTSGGTMTGAIAMGTSKITGVGDPTLAQDAATKAYVDANAGGDVVDDTTPQLGGNLDVQGFSIGSSTADDVTFTDNINVGNFVIRNNSGTEVRFADNIKLNAGLAARFYDADGSNYVGLVSPTTVASDVTFTLPAADGTTGQLLKTDGSGNLSFTDDAGGIALTDISVGAEGTPSGDGSLAYNNTTGVFTYTPPVDITGNSATATALATARTIAGQSFDGTANITVGINDLSDVDTTGIANEKILKYNSTSGNWEIADDSTGSGGLASLVDDTTPQLGGDLDVNGNSIVSASSGNITIDPDGTGQILLNTGTATGTVITYSDDGSAAGPELELKRVSTTAADGDYLGQIRFVGDSDTGADRVYAKITGKIGDATNTTEDGILEISHIKAGSQNINVRMTSTEFKIMNGTDFDVETHDGSSAGLRLANTLVTSTAAELNLLDGKTGVLQDVVDDTSPQLGGNLDVQANSITTSTTDGGITLTPNGTGDVTLGTMTFDADQTIGAGQDNYVLTYDNTSGKISLEAATGGGLANVVDDTTPQLGGTLDMNGNNIQHDTGSARGTINVIGSSGTGWSTSHGVGPTIFKRNDAFNANSRVYLYNNISLLKFDNENTTVSGSNGRFRGNHDYIGLDVNGCSYGADVTGRGLLAVNPTFELHNDNATYEADLPKVVHTENVWWNGLGYDLDYAATSGNNADINITKAYMVSNHFRDDTRTAQTGRVHFVTETAMYHTDSSSADGSSALVWDTGAKAYNIKNDQANYLEKFGSVEQYSEHAYEATHSASGTFTVDYSNGNTQYITLGANITSFTMSNFPGTNNVTGNNMIGSVTLFLQQDGTGGRTISFTAGASETFKIANGITTADTGANNFTVAHVMKVGSTYLWTISGNYT